MISGLFARFINDFKSLLSERSEILLLLIFMSDNFENFDVFELFEELF